MVWFGDLGHAAKARLLVISGPGIGTLGFIVGHDIVLSGQMSAKSKEYEDYGGLRTR